MHATHTPGCSHCHSDTHAHTRVDLLIITTRRAPLAPRDLSRPRSCKELGSRARDSTVRSRIEDTHGFAYPRHGRRGPSRQYDRMPLATWAISQTRPLRLASLRPTGRRRRRSSPLALSTRASTASAPEAALRTEALLRPLPGYPPPRSSSSRLGGRLESSQVDGHVFPDAPLQRHHWYRAARRNVDAKAEPGALAVLLDAELPRVL